MVRLKDIPTDVLEKIEKYVKENKNKIPVKSDGGMDLVKGVKLHFGYMLSPAQIYKLQRGIKSYRVNLPTELVRDLEDRYGGVGKAIKTLAPLLKKPKELSGRAERMWKILIDKGKLSTSEFDELFKDWDDRYEVLGTLFKLGFAHREEDKIVATRYKYDPLISMFLQF